MLQSRIEIFAAFFLLAGCASHEPASHKVFNPPDIGPGPVIDPASAFNDNPVETRKLTGPNSEDNYDYRVKMVVEEIERCPAWTQIDLSNEKTTKDLIRVLQQIARQPTDIVRKAFERFVFQRQAQGQYSTAEMSKLFLIDRYIFKVPALVGPKDRCFFGGWAGVPCSDQTENLLWPFSCDKNGRLKLVSAFRGYAGDDFLAVKEFDFFNAHFGRRESESS